MLSRFKSQSRPLAPALCLLFVFIGGTTSQALAFNSVPTNVNEGQTYQISWSGWDGVSSVQVDLVVNGAQVIDDDIYSEDDDNAPATTFAWEVDLDDGGPQSGIYTLRLISGTYTALSNPVMVTDAVGFGGVTTSASAVSSATVVQPATSPTASTIVVQAPSAASTSGSASSPLESNSPTAPVPSTGILASSSFIAATATTLLTTTILGSVVTITPSALAENETASNETSSNIGTGLGGGAIAGFVIRVITALALIGLGIWYFRRRTKRSRLAHGTSSGSEFEKGASPDSSYLQTAAHAEVTGLKADNIVLSTSTELMGHPKHFSELSDTVTPNATLPKETHELPESHSSHPSPQIADEEGRQGSSTMSRSMAHEAPTESSHGNTRSSASAVSPGEEGAMRRQARALIAKKEVGSESMLRKPDGTSCI